MGLVEQWRRRAVAGAGAGLVAPAAVLAATVAVGFGGGLRGIGALGQAVSGPAVPNAATAADDVRETARVDADLLARVPEHGVRRATTDRRAPRTARSSERAQDAGAPAGAPAVGGGGSTGSATPPASGGGGGGAAAPSGGGATPAPGQPAPPPQQSPVRQVGAAAEQAVGQLPVAGPTGAEVVGGIVDAADELLPRSAGVPDPLP